MPTWYTAPIEKGDVDLRTFALRCATAFVVECRNSSADFPPLKVEPSKFTAERVEDTRKKLERLRAMSVDEADRAALAHYESECQWREEYVVEKELTCARVARLIKELGAWQPGGEYDKLRNLMHEQLTMVLSDNAPAEIPPAVRMSGKEWLIKEIMEAERQLAYYTEQYVRDVENCAVRNRWLSGLRDSLPPKPPAEKQV